MLKDLQIRTRHMKATQFNPKGGKKDIHVGIHMSNLKKEDK
jgi:ribosomal protein L24